MSKRILGIVLVLLLAGTIAFAGGQQGSSTAAPAGGPVVMTLWLARTADTRVTGEAWTRTAAKIEAATGVKIQLQYYDWGESYMQKMNTYVASKDLPSGVWGFSEPIKNSFNLTVLNKMGEVGMLYDLNPYVNDTAKYPTLKKNVGENFLSMTRDKKDGKLYLYPCNIHWEFPHAPGGITIRKDWLDQSGLGYPKNEDDFYKLIKAFKQKFTDTKGNPTIPVSLGGFDQPVMEYEMRFWLNTWMGSGLWYEHDGKYDFARYAKTDELKLALGFLNKLWREDLFDREAFSQKPEQYTEKLINGQIGIHSYSYRDTYKASDTLMQEEPKGTKYFVSIPPFSANPKYTVDQINSCEIITVPMSMWVITKAGISAQQVAKYMEAVNLIGTYEGNLLASIGFENEQWMVKDGKKVLVPAYITKRDATPNYNYIEGLGVVGWMNTNPQVMSEMLQMIVTQKDRLESVINIRGHQKAISDPINTVIPGDVERAKQPLIEQAWLQMVIKAVSATSAAECTAQVDAWPKQLKNLGYDDWVAERTRIAKETTGK
jgi:putative aldouronate transport system substrate-binding protein